MTDEELNEIVARCHKSKFLRELYLDEGLAQEYSTPISAPNPIRAR